MMNKVKTSEEALKVFDLLGVKEVTKEWQKKKGTRVFELPFKTMYYNGHGEINRFSIYHSGYVRKMIVNSNGASYSCYQLNKQYKSKRKYFNSYYKEYRTFDTYKRAMIYNEDDRLVYLCNYILKNYYRNDKCALAGEYTMKRIAEVHTDWYKMKDQVDDQLPFGDMVHPDSTPQDDVQVIINGHRYNLT